MTIRLKYIYIYILNICVCVQMLTRFGVMLMPEKLDNKTIIVIFITLLKNTIFSNEILLHKRKVYCQSILFCT